MEKKEEQLKAVEAQKPRDLFQSRRVPDNPDKSAERSDGSGSGWLGDRMRGNVERDR